MPKFSRLGKEDPMSTLCRMVAETKYEDFPSSVVDFAKRLILDTMGITIGGSNLEGIATIVNFVKEQGGKEESSIPCYGGKKVPASMAGLAIGPMSRAMDMGDVHETEAFHTSEYTLPALLAATGLKNKISGKEFMTAFIVGQEVLIRIGVASKFASGSFMAHAQGGHFIFGVLAATGKLIGLSLEELGNAQGIARGMTQPHDQAMYYPATLMVRVHHGFVAQDAINACLLAKRGITGPREQVLIGPAGYLSQFAKCGADESALTEGLGEDWKMTPTTMKFYPACLCTHTAIDGILDQIKKCNFKFEDIGSIHITESTVNMFAANPYEVRWNPQSVPDCQFSLPYVVATAARDEKVFLDSYTPQARTRKDVRDLMTKISVEEDPSLPPWGAMVTTTLKNGNKYSGEYLYPKGHPKNPLTDQELIDKFKRCAAYSAYKLSDVIIDSVINSLLDLEKVDDVVSALITPVTPG